MNSCGFPHSYSSHVCLFARILADTSSGIHLSVAAISFELLQGFRTRLTPMRLARSYNVSLGKISPKTTDSIHNTLFQIVLKMYLHAAAAGPCLRWGIMIYIQAVTYEKRQYSGF